MDISIASTGLIDQNFTTAQSLSPGKYCVAFRADTSGGQVLGFYKERTTNYFGGNPNSMTLFFNTMVTNVISYSAIMPAQITFPAANFVDNFFHEVFQIKF